MEHVYDHNDEDGMEFDLPLCAVQPSLDVEQPLCSDSEDGMELCANDEEQIGIMCMINQSYCPYCCSRLYGHISICPKVLRFLSIPFEVFCSLIHA